LVPKATEFGEITQINSHYAVQGHSRSCTYLENPYATSYQWIILTSSYLVPFPRYCRKLVKFLLS